MDNWITIMSFTHSHEAYMVKGYLESFGIETDIRDEMTAQTQELSNAIGGVKIIVKESDYKQGIQLLKDGGYLNSVIPLTENNIEIILTDHSTDKKICPFCSSENIGRKKGPFKSTIIIYIILGFIFPIFKLSYKCFDCEKEWKYKKI